MKAKLVGMYDIYLGLLAKLQSPLLLILRLYFGWQFFQTGKGILMHLDKIAGYFATLHIPMPKLNAALARHHRMLCRTAAPTWVGLARHDDPVDLHHDRGLSHGGYGRRQEYLQQARCFSVRGRIPVSAGCGGCVGFRARQVFGGRINWKTVSPS